MPNGNIRNWRKIHRQRLQQKRAHWYMCSVGVHITYERIFLVLIRWRLHTLTFWLMCKCLCVYVIVSFGCICVCIKDWWWDHNQSVAISTYTKQSHSDSAYKLYKTNVHSYTIHTRIHWRARQRTHFTYTQ